MNIQEQSNDLGSARESFNNEVQLLKDSINKYLKSKVSSSNKKNSTNDFLEESENFLREMHLMERMSREGAKTVNRRKSRLDRMTSSISSSSFYSELGDDIDSPFLRKSVDSLISQIQEEEIHSPQNKRDKANKSSSKVSVSSHSDRLGMRKPHSRKVASMNLNQSFDSSDVTSSDSTLNVFNRSEAESDSDSSEETNYSSDSTNDIYFEFESNAPIINVYNKNSPRNSYLRIKKNSEHDEYTENTNNTEKIGLRQLKASSVRDYVSNIVEKSTNDHSSKKEPLFSEDIWSESESRPIVHTHQNDTKISPKTKLVKRPDIPPLKLGGKKPGKSTNISRSSSTTPKRRSTSTTARSSSAFSRRSTFSTLSSRSSAITTSARRKPLQNFFTSDELVSIISKTLCKTAKEQSKLESRPSKSPLDVRMKRKSTYGDTPNTLSFSSILSTIPRTPRTSSEIKSNQLTQFEKISHKSSKTDKKEKGFHLAQDLLRRRDKVVKEQRFKLKDSGKLAKKKSVQELKKRLETLSEKLDRSPTVLPLEDKVESPSFFERRQENMDTPQAIFHLKTYISTPQFAKPLKTCKEDHWDLSDKDDPMLHSDLQVKSNPIDEELQSVLKRSTKQSKKNVTWSQISRLSISPTFSQMEQISHSSILGNQTTETETRTPKKECHDTLEHTINSNSSQQNPDHYQIIQTQESKTLIQSNNSLNSPSFDRLMYPKSFSNFHSKRKAERFHLVESINEASSPLTKKVEADEYINRIHILRKYIQENHG